MTEKEVVAQYPLLQDLAKKLAEIGETDQLRLSSEPGGGFLPPLDLREQLARGRVIALHVEAGRREEE